MPNLTFLCFFLSLLLAVFGCGSKEKKKAGDEGISKFQKKEGKEEKIPASERIDLVNKGIGPVTSLELPNKIDKVMVSRGEDVYKRMCTACHRPYKKFIGPPPAGVLKIRTPEWVMNMMLNPEEMLKKDPLARDLLIEFNGSPMANQNLTRQEARDILEYFRTLDDQEKISGKENIN